MISDAMTKLQATVVVGVVVVVVLAVVVVVLSCWLIQQSPNRVAQTVSHHSSATKL